jgi:pre-mRNA cleavage complex 2 protein Pcf11
MSGEEFEEYASALSELVVNSKPIINALTILAGEIAGKDEKRAEAVAELIRAHIKKSPAKSKLCGFYLLDSVVKNLREPFVRCFSRGLSDLFLPAYAKVDAAQKKSMQRLFGTWKPVFPSSVLDDIEPHISGVSAPSAAAPPLQVVAAPQWQAPPSAQLQQWAPPVQQWVGYGAPQQPYAGYGQHVAVPPPPVIAAANPLAGVFNGGSGGDLSALIASLEAKQASSAVAVVPQTTAVVSLPGEPPALTTDFNPQKDLAELSVRRESVISALYHQLPFQCLQNGRRFRTQAELDAHMDWLHARRKRRRDGTVSRKWFVDISAWLKGLKTLAEDVMNFFGGDDKDSAAEAIVDDGLDDLSVPVDESQPTCALSGEEFEKFWNEAEQEWHYRGAILLDRAVGGAKKGSIVLARAVPKKRNAATKSKASKTAAVAVVKTEDGTTRRSTRGAKTKIKAEGEPAETSPAKRARH